MIRFLSLVAAAWFGMPVTPVAQTAPAGAGPAPAALIEELVLANRILDNRGSTPTDTSASAIRQTRTAT